MSDQNENYQLRKDANITADELALIVRKSGNPDRYDLYALINELMECMSEEERRKFYDIAVKDLVFCSSVFGVSKSVMQNIMARLSDCLSTGLQTRLAKVGVNALIDEATGYQDVRDDDSLRNQYQDNKLNYAPLGKNWNRGKTTEQLKEKIDELSKTPARDYTVSANKLRKKDIHRLKFTIFCRENNPDILGTASMRNIGYNEAANILFKEFSENKPEDF